MTAQEIRNYIKTRNEADALRIEIDELKKQGQLTDVVSGSYDVPPFTKHSITLRGNSDRRLAEIERKKAQLAELTARMNAVEEFVDSIPDWRIRKALRLKYLKGYTWVQVANRMPGESAWSAKKACERFMKGSAN